MKQPRWVAAAAIRIIHDEQLAEHGGGRGVRDPGLLDSPLARPLNAWSYGETDLYGLAAL